MIKEDLKKIKTAIPENVKLVAVSKTKPVPMLEEAYEAGQRHFGENRVQELEEKYTVLPKDVKWHMIGHLQSKKVKKIAPFVHLIHGVDSFKLLREINKQAFKNERTINCLFQFHIAQEATKFGLSFEEVEEILKSDAFSSLNNIRVCGVMGMATLTDSLEQIHAEFRALKEIFDEIKSKFSAQFPHFTEISMGMSGDYEIAIEEGSTMIRLGSSIFGSRG
ncbi:MAG: YggS family pyridoxal phosphate-dependent enzyme [Crocinitomix sp.]|nr:YggS family pyridoxal phosphate-dependent enzyme [Crocinitomix sp.]